MQLSTVLITGASSGIGRETALKFAKEGHSVIINCKNNVKDLMLLKEELEGKNLPVLALVEDVAQFPNVGEMFDIMAQKNMLPDIIINNAGISHIGLLQDMSAEQWAGVMNTNLTSVFNCSKAAIPYLLRKGGGKILNISSIWGNVGASCEVAYSASKGGINSFTKALAKELAPSNIQVNAIAFGAVDTRMNAFLDSEELNSLILEIPSGRLCTPAEAAEIIYTIASLSSYVTGQIITADGGMT